MCVLFPFPLPNFQGQGIPWGTYVSQFLISYEPVLGRLFPFWGTILQTTNLFFPWEKFLVVSALHTFLCLSSLCGWKSEERSRSKAVSGRPKRWSKALLKAFFFFLPKAKVNLSSVPLSQPSTSTKKFSRNQGTWLLFSQAVIFTSFCPHSMLWLGLD